MPDMLKIKFLHSLTHRTKGIGKQKCNSRICDLNTPTFYALRMNFRSNFFLGSITQKTFNLRCLSGDRAQKKIRPRKFIRSTERQNTALWFSSQYVSLKTYKFLMRHIGNWVIMLCSVFLSVMNTWNLPSDLVQKMFSYSIHVIAELIPWVMKMHMLWVHLRL